MLIDSHAHLDMGAFDSDRPQVIDRALSADVRLIIAVGVDIRTSMRAVTLAKGYSSIFTSVGIHPHNDDNTDQNDLTQVALLATQEKVVAIIDMGYYISIPGSITFKNASKMQDVARRVPLNKMPLFLLQSPIGAKETNHALLSIQHKKLQN